MGTSLIFLSDILFPWQAVAPYLPRGEPRLAPEIYEMVLNEFLQTDHVVGYRGSEINTCSITVSSGLHFSVCDWP